jgi:adhesin/invasin
MRHAGLVLVVATLASGCVPADPPPVAGGSTGRVVATFTGEADLAAGTLVITARGASRGEALTELEVVQDGQPGTGPDDTVELVTEGAAAVAGGCGAVDAFEGRVRLRSFYTSACLRNAYVEILQIAPSGREACNSAPAVPGVSSALGLFAYGTLAKKGLAGSSASAAWRFRLPDATHFSFRGRIVADVVAACASPGLPGAPGVPLAGVPAGVAVADLAGDALPDLATVSRAGTSAVLELAAGAGGGRFAAPTATTLGSIFASPAQTALADVRGSAALDVLYTDGSGNFVVHENLGGGAFGPATAYAAAGAKALATADLDGDGDGDVVVAGTGVTAFLNANGTLTPLILDGATSSGHAVVIADIDYDGVPGIIAVNGADLVLIPQRTIGGFGFATADHESVPLAGAELRDVAVIHHLPQAHAYAANRGNSCLARFRGNRPGKALIYDGICLALPFAPERIAAGDFDGDGTEDLAAAGSGIVQVLLTDATQASGFRSSTYGGVPGPTALVVRDVDGSGTLDLVVGSATAGVHAVLLNAGGGALRAPGRVAAGAGAEGVAAVDLDGDGRPDLAVANRTALSVTPLRSSGGGAFSAGAAVPVPSAPVAIAAGDVNRDGRADVAVALSGGSVCLLAGDGAGALGAPTCTAIGAAPAGLALLDLTGDGALDAAVTLGDAAGSVLVLGNDGAGALARAPLLDATATPRAEGIVAADLDADGRADLAVAGDALAVLRNTGAGLGPAVLASNHPGARALAVGDLDGDGRPDVVTTGPDELQVFLADGAGGFSFEAALPFPAPAAVAIEDLDGDGVPDLAATSSSRGFVGVVRNRGTGAFDATVDGWVPWPAGATGAGLVAADLDGDLRVDLAATDSAGGAVDVLRAVCLP